MKRGSERQLTADAASDSDGEENAGSGTWEKASGAELSQRKILRVRRDRKEIPTVSTFSSDSLTGSSSNPFGAMKGFVAAAPATKPPAAAPAPSAFPSGFTFGATAPTAAPKAMPSFGSTAAPTAAGSSKGGDADSTATPVTGFSNFATFSSSAQGIGSGSGSASKAGEKAAQVQSSLTFSSSPSAADGTYGAKMTQLNTALLAWMHKQQEQAPLGLWSRGLEDYVLHAERLAKQFGVSGPSTHPAAPAKAETGAGAAAAAKPTPAPAPAPAAEKPLFSPAVPAAPAASAPAPAFAFGAPAAAAAMDGSGSAGFSWGNKGKEAGGIGNNNAFALPPNSVASLPLPTFGLKAPAASTASTEGFGFGFGAPVPAPAATGASFGAPVLASASGGGDDDDDEGEPILEPEVVLRDENDKDEILFQADCSLRRMDMKAEPKPEWKDLGKGSLRVTHDPTTGVRRILVREKSMGKVTLNASFFSAQKFDKVGKASIRFPAVVPNTDAEAAEGSTSLNTFLIKTKESDTDNAIAALVSARDSKK